MLRSIGMPRAEVYIANILKCRPPGNRDPQPSEAAECTPYLNRQIELVRPNVILAVGRIAAQWLLQSDAPIGRLRGRVLTYGEAGTPLIVTYHPAYLLRSPLSKATAWTDLCHGQGSVEQRAMSAAVIPRNEIRLMQPSDLKSVAGVERAAYDYPWSLGIFRDCLLAGYHCIVLDVAGSVTGYGIMSIAAAEAHLLNLCVHPHAQSVGYGRRLLEALLQKAADSNT